MLVSVPVNGNKRGAKHTFPSAYWDHPFPAERAVQAIPVFKRPNAIFRQKTYNTHGISIEAY
jgi:hypothetical protein